MNIDDIKKLNIPKQPGSYQYRDMSGKIIYIGKAADLRSRVLSYWRESAQHTPAKQRMLKEIVDIQWIEVDSEIEALLLEANLIKKFQPKYNIDLRDDKRFAYIKVSTEDEVPGVFITRRIDRAGKYFGPFTNMVAVRETLKALRKIWPYCTERKVKAKPCFYYQINKCLGPCGGVVAVQDYRREVILPIIKFLSGKKKQVIREIEKEIKSAETRFIASQNKADEDRLRYLKYKLINMNKVLEHTHIISIAEKYAADVVELAKVLSLPKVPERIEGYDISNIFGQEAVGSMVVFKNGEPDKGEYKKFKIKIDDGLANDTGMLKEVLERRFKHSIKSPLERGAPEGRGVLNGGNSRATKNPPRLSLRESHPSGGGDYWALPDLIIIDGGKGQLNAAVRAIKKAKLDPSTSLGTGIPVLAVSKGEGLRSAAAPDKIFFPGEKKPLELPLASPALHIIKRVRDEAHRFAIKYHQLLRKKKMFK